MNQNDAWNLLKIFLILGLIFGLWTLVVDCGIKDQCSSEPSQYDGYEPSDTYAP